MQIHCDSLYYLKYFNAALVLENGNYFLGSGLGYPAVTTGELCFNTAMTGYQEAITDPSYAGQIVTFTFPHIGNVGINEEDNEDEHPLIQGVVFRSTVSLPSNYRAKKDLATWLYEKKIVGITEVDTRDIVKKIRTSKRSLKASIGYWKEGLSEEKLNFLKNKAKQDNGLVGSDFGQLVKKKVYSWSGHSWGKPAPCIETFKIVVLDFGVKRSILRKLCDLGCLVTVLPGDSSLEEILSYSPDGVILSNGPGDPRQTFLRIKHTLDSLINLQIPLFGICLGHQMLALSLGGTIEKMPCGHHGINHPVQDLLTKKIHITSQNHEFVVSFKDKSAEIEITHISLFDGSIEGFSVKRKPILCVQFHPEAAPGPQDSEYLFANFLEIIQKNKMYNPFIQKQKEAYAASF